MKALSLGTSITGALLIPCLSITPAMVPSTTILG